MPFPDDIAIEWCDQDPGHRYQLMAAVANLFKSARDPAPEEWNPVTQRLLAKAPHPEAVLNEIIQSPMAHQLDRLASHKA